MTDLGVRRTDLRNDDDGPAVADEAAIREVYEQHGASMTAYAIRLTGSPAIADDVVQEALIRVWQHPEVLVNGKGSVRGWLLTVIRNLVTDRRRSIAARPAEVDGVLAEAHPAVGDHAQDVVETVAMADALAALSPDHRAVLLELYYHGRNTMEAAEALGVPVGTVRSRTHYAMRELRTVLRRRPVTPPAGRSRDRPQR